MTQGSAPVAESVDRQRAAIDAIAQSACFRRSPRLRDMLVHIGNASLSGNLDDLTESRIAAKVFGRPEYNPAEDNLVRVSARQLRNKITEYYEGDGRFDEIVLEVPKGGYLGVFHTRREFEAETLAATPASALPTPQAKTPAASWLTFAFAGLAAALLVLAGWLWHENSQLRRVAVRAAPPVLFDAALPGSGQRTKIVITDSALVLFERLMHQYVGLTDYATGRYLQFGQASVESDLIALLRSRQISSLADFHIISNVLRRYSPLGISPYIEHSRNMRVRDFDTGDNFVLIGSSRSNPWASLFETQLAFQLDTEYGHACFKERQPSAGSRRIYCVQDSTNEEGTDYAHVALVHTGNGRGRALLIAGADMESTEAAGNFVLDPDSAQTVLRALAVQRIADLPDFELLLKTYSLEGSGRSPELVYAHKL